MKLSPMMEQYMNIKKDYADCILFFRLGDFYEMFFEDAITASKVLELTLTGRNCGQEERAPMCGVPFHSAEIYIGRLVEKGFKVAICEQVEDPETAKGIVKREVIKVVTPGTLMSQSMLKDNENNYLASLYFDGKIVGLSYCDLSTGELMVTEEDFYENSILDFSNQLVKINTKEVLLNSSALNFLDIEQLKLITNALFEIKEDNYFSKEGSQSLISSQLKLSMTALGIDGKTGAISALGGLLSYLLETQKQAIKQFIGCRFYKIGNTMALDKATIRNLEITETLYEKTIKGSLLGILDKTNTAMGSRTMKKWLREPLNTSSAINKRLDAVEELIDNPLLLNHIREALKSVYDFQRLTGRIASGSANGKDLIALKQSVSFLPEIKDSLSQCNAPLNKEIFNRIGDLNNVYDIIESSIVENPPFTIKEGGVIKDGFSPELDELKFSIKDGKDFISSLESIERERTGIKTLKVGYNKVFGYYIDVTKANSHLVPDEYIRKQTLVNSERYITPKMKEVESVVLNGETKINKLEYDLFSKIREELEQYIKILQETSEAVAEIDVLCSFAKVSSSLNYVKPKVDDSHILSIEKGRHPVVENASENMLFVSNDTYLNNKEASMAIITGPNMAGKSTYMRQTALIVLMAQSGCFVPCSKAHIGVCDRIFTRIGASDNLSQGQSTFFVEMSELSYILNCAKDKSLIILDEIGRGTSTYDGMSIASATVHFLCNKEKRIRTMFATHYHELTALEKELEGVVNLNVDVAEENGDILFLHKIVPGSASRSYGIHVAKIAGIPKILLDQAEGILEGLEGNNNSDGPKLMKVYDSESPYEEQLSLFNDSHPVIEKLKNLDLMEITPSQSIKIIEDLKELI